jgi:hypothetical protein
VDLQAGGKLLLPDRAAGAVTDHQFSNLGCLLLIVFDPGAKLIKDLRALYHHALQHGVR